MNHYETLFILKPTLQKKRLGEWLEEGLRDSF